MATVVKALLLLQVRPLWLRLWHIRSIEMLMTRGCKRDKPLMVTSHLPSLQLPRAFLLVQPPNLTMRIWPLRTILRAPPPSIILRLWPLRELQLWERLRKATLREHTTML